MLSVADVQQAAAKRFSNRWRTWACDLLTDGLFGGGGSSDPVFPLSFGLKPPTERGVLAENAYESVQTWVSDWRACFLPGTVDWETRAWPRVGQQRIPVRLSLASADDIAAWAGEEQLWQIACSRMTDLGKFLSNEGAEAETSDTQDFDVEALHKSVHKSVAAWCFMSDADWQRTLAVLAWLLHHPHEQLFVRQLPIHGVHTKWIETHGGALQPLYQALTGYSFSFAAPGHLYRCVALDPALGWGAVRTFALEADRLAQLPVKPKQVLICENQVNVESLASFLEAPGTLAIHGGGFAVTELSRVSWLHDVPIYYWGDLDTNGFAILHALRTYFPYVESVLMDLSTLKHHLDLAVEEPKPITYIPDRLTAAELEAFEVLRAGNRDMNLSSLRLEQERIEWRWTLERLREALGI